MAYADEVTADSPRIWWKLDETAGTTANDSSSGGTFDGTYAGSYTLDETTCPNGDGAMRITGLSASDKVSVTHSSHNPSAITLEVWVKPYALADYTCYVNDWVETAGYGNGMFYSTALGGFGGGRSYTGAPPPANFGQGDGRGTQRDILRNGEWTHLVYTCDGTVIRFYVDGKQINYTWGGISAATITDLKWGDAAYAHFAVYDTALSPARILAHYEAMVSPSTPDRPYVVDALHFEGGNPTGEINVPIPASAVAGDLVIVSACGADNSDVVPAYFNLDGLTTTHAEDLGSSGSPSASHGTLTSTAISNGYLRARTSGDAFLPINRYYSFTVVVLRSATTKQVLTAPTSAANAARSAAGRLFIATETGFDSSSSPWDLARNKAGADGYGLVCGSPTKFKTLGIAWQKEVGDSSFATTRTAGVSGDDKTFRHNWVIGPVSATDSYEDQVLDDGPIGFWPCDEPSGSTVADISGNGLDGTLNGTCTLNEAGPKAGVPSVLMSNSSGSYVESTFGSWTSTGLTIEYWIKANGIADFYPQVGLGTWSAWGGRFWTHGDNSNRAFFGSGSSNSTQRLEVANAYVPTGTWYHFVFTCTAAKLLTVYRNGVSIASGTRSGFNLEGSATYFRFGHHANFSNVALYPTALSAARVQAHYEAMFPPQRLAAYRRLRRPRNFGAISRSVR